MRTARTSSITNAARRFLFAWLLMIPVALLGAPPSIQRTTPYAVAPDKSVDVTFFGKDLAGATHLWTSFPAKVELTPDIEKNGTEGGKITFRLTVPAETPIGVGGVRLASSQGVSSLALLMIDDLPTLAQNPRNRKFETAQAITIPTAVDGTCEGTSFDYYRFSAKKGQRVSIEVFAQRLGTQLDAVVRLLDSEQRELAYSDDELGTQSDSRLSWVFQKDGDYTIQLRDINYGGGAAHRYRLRVGDFPLVTVPYPMGARLGEERSLEVAGPLVEGAEVPAIKTDADDRDTAKRVPVRFPGGASSSYVTVLTSDLTDTLEVEPNNEREKATPAAVPGALNGRFTTSKDRDFFRFEAKKGQRLSFRGITRRMGSPSDLFFRLYNAKGAMLAEIEDSGSDEGRFEHTFAEDGAHVLMVEDLLRRHGPEHAYRVEVREHAPRFSLRVEAEKFDAPKGGVFVAKVLCDRAGYDGPVELSIDGAGEGFELSGHVIGKGKKDTTLRARVPDRFETGQAVPFRIVGTAKVGEQTIRTTASSITPLRKSFSRTPYPPVELDGHLAIGIRPVFKDFFKVSLVAPADEILVPRFGDDLNVPIVAQRIDKGFKDPIGLEVSGLPKGLTATVNAVPKDKIGGAIVLKPGPELAVGEYAFQIRARATFQNQPKESTLANVKLRVVEPLQLLAAPIGSGKPGQKQKVRLSVIRASSKLGAVEIVWDSLPGGIKGPATTTIPANQNEIEVELELAGNLPPNSLHRVAALARAKIGDANIESKSPVVLVKVAKP